jgi:hypothetical protein
MALPPAKSLRMLVNGVVLRSLYDSSMLGWGCDKRVLSDRQCYLGFILTFEKKRAHVRKKNIKTILRVFLNSGCHFSQISLHYIHFVPCFDCFYFNHGFGLSVAFPPPLPWLIQSCLYQQIHISCAHDLSTVQMTVCHTNILLNC